MSDATHYVIRGGIQGRERLRVLSRVMHPTSASRFDRLGLRDGLVGADIGCGGGDATVELARRVGPHGKAIGLDIDEAKLEIARAEAQQPGVTNVDFKASDIRQASASQPFDVVHARFFSPISRSGEHRLNVLRTSPARRLDRESRTSISAPTSRTREPRRRSLPPDVLRYRSAPWRRSEHWTASAYPSTLAGTPRIVQAWGRRPV